MGPPPVPEKEKKGADAGKGGGPARAGTPTMLQRGAVAGVSGTGQARGSKVGGLAGLGRFTGGAGKKGKK